MSAEPQTSYGQQRLQALADAISSLMQRRGLNEHRLALASGVSPRTVANFLRPANRRSNGDLPSGTIANLCKLANALGVEPWELLAERSPFHAAVERAYQERVTGEALERK